MKTNTLTQIWKWVLSNLFIIVITLFYAAYGVLHYIQPHYSWFVIQRDLIALGQILVGFVEIPIRIFTFYMQKIPIEITAIVVFIYFVAIGLGLGIIVKTFWTKGSGWRFVIVVAFIINCTIGLIIVFKRGIIVEAQPSKTCENFISTHAGMRIFEFDEVRVFSGAHYFYLFSSNGGKSWEQLMTVQLNARDRTDCSTISSLDDDFIWIWYGYGVRTTKDYGQTWTKWDLECYSQRFIKTVEFQSPEVGSLEIYLWGSPLSELHTSDGGKTWNSSTDKNMDICE
jgi:hypothetical protein